MEQEKFCLIGQCTYTSSQVMDLNGIILESIFSAVWHLVSKVFVNVVNIQVYMRCVSEHLLFVSSICPLYFTFEL